MLQDEFKLLLDEKLRVEQEYANVKGKLSSFKKQAFKSEELKEFMETLEEFEKRSYVSFIRGHCLVWKDYRRQGVPEIWDLQTNKNYIDYLSEAKK